jgi:hypothetical protein
MSVFVASGDCGAPLSAREREQGRSKMMSQPPCEPLVETIEKLTQDLDTIEEQLQALQVEGMNQLLPWRYLALPTNCATRLLKNYS